MYIREATEEDIPQIVNLLKISLGESLMPKSEAFWRWKHIDNPFGKSPVLLAFEGDLLVGVRAFMRWEWRMGDTIFKSVRAVDTATHPEYQGKGIFKKLTLRLVEMCEQEGIHFIFNTPNSKSMPGYLKMGWENMGKLSIRVRPILFSKPDLLEPEIFSGDIPFPIENSMNLESKMVTRYSLSFFKWRYAGNPFIKYYQIVEKEGILIYRLKKGKLGNEFRIVDQVGHNSYGHILNFAKRSKARFISSNFDHKTLLRSTLLPLGPAITVRNLDINFDFNYKLWKPMLGDMEVF